MVLRPMQTMAREVMGSDPFSAVGVYGLAVDAIFSWFCWHRGSCLLSGRPRALHTRCDIPAEKIKAILHCPPFMTSCLD